MTTLAKCIGPDASDARTIQRLAERCLRERRAALVRLDLIEDERLRAEIEAEAERQLELGEGRA